MGLQEGKAQVDDPWERRHGRPAFAYRLEEAALRSASDREVLIIRALYGFAGVLQGRPVNCSNYCCGIDFEVHSTALLSAMEKALQLFCP